MRLKLRFGFVLAVGVMLAASGCKVGESGDDAGEPPDTGTIPLRDAGPDSGPLVCEAGEIDCGGVCARVAADSQNCGSCGTVCPTGFSCAVGRCDCAEPMKSCDGVCVDVASDTDNCGSCGNACATGETCLDGECTVECDEPEVRCTRAAAEGESPYVCADLQTDSMNCGACGATCAGGATCQAGYCMCAASQVSCSGTCTDLATDAENCGACLNSCGADGVCTSGACSTCGTGLTACGSPRRCVDTSTSRLHCGACDNTCGPGEGCNSGTCECLPGFTDCSGLCANLMGDPHNCGGCGIDCGRGGTCSAGVCTCAAGATMCGAECAVLSEDREHCGDCDTACGPGESCVLSTCVVINDTCETAYAVTGDVTFSDEETADGGSRPMGTGCGGGSGNEALFYAVTIPAGQEVAMTTSTSDDLVVFELASCGLTTCAQSSDFPEALTLTNLGTTDVTRIVGVRSWSSADDSTYDISFAYSTPVVAPNATCATATPITATTSITGEDTEEGGPRPSGSNCGGGGSNKALYYAVTLDPGDVVNVTTSTSGDLVLFELGSCSDTNCLVSTDFPEALTLNNTGTAPTTIIVGVRGYSGPTGFFPGGPFDITFTYTP